MKTILQTAFLVLLTTGAAQAQEKIEEIKTTRTTVKSSLGNDTVVKKEITTKVTPVQLDPEEAGQLNQTLQRGETIVKKETTYNYNDSKFKLIETDKGYNVVRMQEGSTARYGTMRKLAKGDVYLLKTKDGISISYFDNLGNMVSEKYDDADDSVTITKFQVQPEKTKTMNSDKM